MEVHGKIDAPKYLIEGVDVTNKIKNAPDGSNGVLDGIASISLSGEQGKLLTVNSAEDGYELSSYSLADKENISNKDSSSGYVGLTLFKINFKNILNTFTSFITNNNTSPRTYTFQDRDGVIADTGNLSQFATTSSSQLAGIISDKTGTGSLVFSTSPSLTTPSIGSSGANFNGLTSGTSNLKAQAVAGATNFTLPVTSGVLIGTGDVGSVTSEMILDGTLVNADVSVTANIAAYKLQQATIVQNKAQPVNNDTLDTINNKQLGLINTRTSIAPLEIANLATGGVIGIAPNTVDINSIFLINQTTGGQTLILPNPTNTTLGQVVSVISNSTASFIMYGVTIIPTSCQDFLWTGTSWIRNNISTPQYFTATSQATMLALNSVKAGDFCVRTDTTPLGIFRLTATPASTLSNWKSNITGTLYGRVDYGLSAAVSGLAINTTINFNTLLHSIGNTNFISNVNGVLTLQPGYMYELEGFAAHYNSSTSGGIAFRWRVNGAGVGTYGGSAVANVSDINLGASSTARYSFSIAVGDATKNFDLVLTGWQNLNVYNGSANIPSSYISIKAYNL